MGAVDGPGRLRDQGQVEAEGGGSGDEGDGGRSQREQAILPLPSLAGGGRFLQVGLMDIWTPSLCGMVRAGLPVLLVITHPQPSSSGEGGCGG